jgi:hypothetical protein
MTRQILNVNNGIAESKTLTPSEDAVIDAEEGPRMAAWTANEGKRAALEEIQRLESSVTPRRIREMTTDSGKQWVNNVEELIAIERGKL